MRPEHLDSDQQKHVERIKESRKGARLLHLFHKRYYLQVTKHDK
jgi:hypothetical protein